MHTKENKNKYVNHIKGKMDEWKLPVILTGSFHFWRAKNTMILDHFIQFSPFWTTLDHFGRALFQKMMGNCKILAIIDGKLFVNVQVLPVWYATSLNTGPVKHAYTQVNMRLRAYNARHALLFKVMFFNAQYSWSSTRSQITFHQQ